VQINRFEFVASRAQCLEREFRELSIAFPEFVMAPGIALNIALSPGTQGHDTGKGNSARSKAALKQAGRDARVFSW
jgi:hypothetical protein